MITLILGPGICAFAEVFNDCKDIRYDSKGTQKYFIGIPISGGSGVLLNGGQEAFLLAKYLIGVSIGIGILACCFLPFRITPLIITGYILSWMYSGQTFQLKHKGFFGILIQGIGYGPIAFYIGYGLSKPLTIDIGFLLAILIGSWTALVGITADLLDYKQDAEQGVKTFVVNLGEQATKLLAVLSGTVCLTLGFILSDYSKFGLKVILLITTVIIFLTYSWMLIGPKNRVIKPKTHAIAVLLELLYPIMLSVK